MNIDEIIQHTVELEGGYVNDPDDHGGATKFGITEATARANGYTGNMMDLSLEFACRVYKQQYFTNPHFDRVYELSPAIAQELFDTAVNMGTKTASNFLQKALNLLNQNQTLYSNITIDGDIGNATLSALKVVLQRQNCERVMLRVLNGLQFMRYVAIVDGNESQKKFFWGWTLNRIS